MANHPRSSAGTETASDDEPDPWGTRKTDVPPGSEHFPDLIAAARRVQCTLSATNPPSAVVLDATTRLHDLATELDSYEVPIVEVPYGRRHEVPGRAHLLLPPIVTDDRTDSQMTGRVVFPGFFQGGNGVAHGGALTVLFDELLGQLVNSAGRPTARTAYLHVNYRSVCPLDHELQIEASVDRQEGRKIYASARVREGDVLISDAEGLFVALLPGQR